ncbi:11-domain light and oxygen sensing his kinase [Halorubrum coriense DSM 10284]|uniref:histidine kinase n=1 Tax=Halorubrum coriense DSM 10284 TaxID=1227466 RepID=M0E8T2_9EURY|nr:PAS domain-containing protein [Halorubrum coriense]ELZ44175.1 11-domain light and oxygen sensing his kinase [Halorubrum coriense DSM 10284]
MEHASDGRPERIHVLYVNGDADFAELARAKLERIAPGVTVTTVGDTRVALSRVAEGSVDCLVTSYSLPEGTGIDLVARAETERPDLPTVLFTGRGSERIASEATQAGVSDYIPIHGTQDSFELLAGRVRTLVDAARKQATAERLSDRFQRTLERATDAIYAVDGDWRVEYMNDTMAERIERDPERIVGNTIWEAFPSIVGTELEERYRTAMATGEPASFEQRLGDPFDYWVEVRAFPDEDGLTVFSREITDERERERELERSEAVLENVHDAVTVVDEDGSVAFANAAANRLLSGRQSADLTGKRLSELAGDRVDEADARAFSEAVELTLDEMESDGGLSGFYDADLRIDVAVGDGERTFDIRLTPFQRRATNQVLVVARDVTERSAAKHQLERERDALRELQTVMAESDTSSASRLRNLLRVGCRTLGLEIGIVSRAQGGDYTVEAVHAPDADVEAGDRFDLASTYCAEVVGTDSVCSFADAVSEGKATHPAYRELELESYIGVPLVVDGARYGTVNFSSPTTRVAPFGALERTFVELLAELVSAELSRARDRADLERREFLFDRVQDIADIGVWEYFPAREELTWSDGTRRIHGVDEGYEPSIDDAIEFYHPDDRETITDAVDTAIEDGKLYDLDLRIERADGGVRDVRAWGEFVEDARRGDAALRGVFQDVTEREAKRREHQALAEEYAALLETSGDAIFLLDVDAAGDEPSFEFARLSPGYESQTGLTTADVRGETPRAVFGDEQGAELAANYARCVEEGAPISYHEELETVADGRFWETSLAPVTVDGETVRIVGIARNVTERVERERELETTNQRLESLIEATPLTVMEVDADGGVVRWNEEAETMFGWSHEEVRGARNPLASTERWEEFAAHRRRALRGERVRAEEVRLETKAGDTLDLLLSIAPITAPDGEVTGTLAVVEDITDQKRLEARLRALQETAQRLSSAESAEAIGSVAVDAAADVLGLDVTAAWEFDRRADALVPVSETDAATDLLGEAPRFDSGEGLAWDAFESGETRVYDDVHDADRRYNSDTAIQSEVVVPLGEYGVMITGSTSPREFCETDVDLFRILGATVEAAFARASREAELQRQNERLDEFASVVAHDLRNPLTVAQGFLELATETGDPDHFARVQSAHDRTERLIDDLLALARGETAVEDAEAVDLGTVTTEAWGYVDTDEAALAVADAVPTVTGDPGRLTQLFENLFRNAVEHGGPTVTVTVGQSAGDGGFYVEDDGSGIPPDRRDDVLRHGVTSSDGGTGFGLSIVADIAEAHGWTVSVTDGSDGGARFEFDEAA